VYLRLLHPLLLLLFCLLLLFRRHVVTDDAATGGAKNAVMCHVSGDATDNGALDAPLGLGRA
jgi:hypothetical protein